jgi:hypothetical protein
MIITLGPVDDWLLTIENSCHPHASPQNKTFVGEVTTECPYYIKGPGKYMVSGMGTTRNSSTL